MDKKKKEEKELRTFERAIGIQLAEHGSVEAIPEGVRLATEKRARRFGLTFLEDFEI